MQVPWWHLIWGRVELQNCVKDRWINRQLQSSAEHRARSVSRNTEQTRWPCQPQEGKWPAPCCHWKQPVLLRDLYSAFLDLGQKGILGWESKKQIGSLVKFKERFLGKGYCTPESMGVNSESQGLIRELFSTKFMRSRKETPREGIRCT